MYYLCIFLVLVFGALFEQFRHSPRDNQRLFWLSYLMLMLTAGLRYETGGDWTSYTEIFDMIEPIDRVMVGNSYYFDVMPLEWGYKYLNSILKWVCDNVQFLFFVVALIISSFVFKGISRYSLAPITSVLIYFGILFFALDMIVLRQGIAVALVFWGYRFVEEKKFWHFFAVCIAAMLFHVSAIVGLAVYLMCRKRYSTRLLTLLAIGFVGVLVLQVRWLGGIATLLLSTQVDAVVAHKIVAYTTNEGYAVARGLSLGLLANLGVLAAVLWRRKELEKQPYFNLFLNLFVLYLFVYCCMSEFVEFANRLKYFFMISLVVLIPQVVWSFKNVHNKLITYVAACGFAFFYCHAQLLERPIASAFNPYQNYLIYRLFPYESDGRERLEQSDEAYGNERAQ